MNERVEGKFKNWYPFFEWLTGLWEEEDAKRKKELDPFRQLILDEKKVTIVSVRRLYETYLNSGLGKDLDANAQGENLGLGFLKELEKLEMQTKELAEKQTKKYMMTAYRQKLNVIKKIIAQFTGFILAP